MGERVSRPLPRAQRRRPIWRALSCIGQECAASQSHPRVRGTSDWIGYLGLRALFWGVRGGRASRPKAMCVILGRPLAPRGGGPGGGQRRRIESAPAKPRPPRPKQCSQSSGIGRGCPDRVGGAAAATRAAGSWRGSKKEKNERHFAYSLGGASLSRHTRRPRQLEAPNRTPQTISQPQTRQDGGNRRPPHRLRVVHRATAGGRRKRG